MLVVCFPRLPPDDRYLSAVISAGHTALVGGGPVAPWLLTEAATKAPVIIGGGVSDLHRLPLRPGKWLAWDLYGEPGFAHAALSAGALAVLPETTSADDLGRLVSNLAASRTERTGPRDRRYRERSLVPAEADAMIEIVEGVVARIAVHPDGNEAVLCLHGPGEFLTGHSGDDCNIEFVAVNDIVVRTWPWSAVSDSPATAARLREQLLRVHVWSAVRARPTVELRLLGLLEQIAGRFGEDSPRGRLIPFRVTHGLLAAAVGANRSTVSRTMAALARAGRVCYQGEGGNRRVVVARPSARIAGHA